MQCLFGGKLPPINAILNLLLVSISSAASCYWLDGSVATYRGYRYTPCTNNSVSMCCLLAEGDSCTSQGLCKSSTGALYRNACTDQTWTSASCLALCPGVVEYAQINICADNSLCCAENSTCCANGQGVFINSNGTLSSDLSTPTSTHSPPSSSTANPASSNPAAIWQFITNNAWLATPIVAAIGWINTWLVSAILAGRDYRFVADCRYVGLAKRTIMAAFLADDDNSTPKQVIGCAAMDSGLSSQLKDLSKCKASSLSYIIWIVQLGAILYAIFVALFAWTQDSSLQHRSDTIQFPLLLGVLNINRGTWAIAAAGSIIPGRGKLWLVITTVIAVVLDILFIARAFVMAWHINNTYVMQWVGIVSWILPAIEGSILTAGLIAARSKVTHPSPMWLLFIPGALWLSLGPLFIIVVSIMSHYSLDFLGT